MQTVVLANDELKNELLQDTTDKGAAVTWVADVSEFSAHADADVFVDLLYHNSESRNRLLKSLFPKTVIINSVIDTLQQTNASFVRINSWPTFLKGNIIEAACSSEAQKATVESVFKRLGKVVQWLPDTPGFVTPRVVSMIINEAFLALQEGVSTPEEIDTAMKLGTAYPYGPFEWSKKIGLQNIATLLQTLSATQPRYTPAPLLLHEVDKAI